MLSVILQYSSSSEVVILTLCAVVAAFLAIVVLRENAKSATHRIFAILTLSTVLWLECTYIVRVPELYNVSLVIHRFGIFFAALMSFMFFLLGVTMPSDKITLSKQAWYLSLSATIGMMLLNLSPYAFTSVLRVGESSVPQPGFGLIPFASISTLFSVLAVYFLAKSYVRTTGIEKKQIALILWGIVTMLSLIICTILLPIATLNSTMFLPFTPLYALIFLGFTAYAITNYQLFHVKVLLTQALIIVIDVVLFARLFSETSISIKIIDSLVFAFMIIVGFFLIRSVKQEVQQREIIEKQEKELEDINTRLRDLDKQKNEFLSFASHQLRTPLTAIKWSAGAILDGMFDAVPPKLKEPMQTIFEESSLMAVFINDYLNVSRIEQGKMEYRFIPTNLGDVIKTTASQMAPSIKEKGLALITDIPDEAVMVWADASKVTQIISNLIDNAVKYTPKGNITVSMKKLQEYKKVRIEIRDSGIGMNKDTLDRVFEKFSRGENAKEVNSAGSGLGLFIVKTFVEAHKGTIRIESGGEGKGTIFIIEFPLLVQSGVLASA